MSRFEWLLPSPTALRAVLVATVALLVRVPGSRWGLPYPWHPDEPAVLNPAYEMMKTGDFNPHLFNYPSFPIYLHLGGAVLGYLRLAARGEAPPLERLDTGVESGVKHVVGSPELWQDARLLGCALGALGAALLVAAGTRLYGRVAGVVAGALFALAPLAVVHARYATVDGPAAVGVAALLWATTVIWRTDDRGAYVAAGLVAGLTVACKYNLAPMVGLPLLAWWFRPEARAARPWLGPALIPLAALGFFLGAPYVILDLGAALADIAAEVRHYAVVGHGESTVEPGLPHLLRAATALALDGWSTFGVASLAGLVVLARSEPRVALVLLLPWLVYLAEMVGTRVFFERNLLPLLPALALWGGVGASAAVEWVGRGGRGRWWGLAAGGAALVGPPVFQTTDDAIRRVRAVDTRVTLATWIGEHPEPGRVVALPRELRLRAEDFGPDVVEVPIDAGPRAWAAAGATHVVGARELSVHLARGPYTREQVAAWSANFAGLREVKVLRGLPWAVDQITRGPGVGLYALDADPAAPSVAAAPEAVDPALPADAAPPPEAPAVAARDPAGRWSLFPKGVDPAVARADGGEVHLDHVAASFSRACRPLDVTAGPVRVRGSWTLAGVDEPNAAAVLVRVTGGGDRPQIEWIARGSGDRGATSFEGVLTPRKDATRIEACVELKNAVGRVDVTGFEVTSGG